MALLNQDYTLADVDEEGLGLGRLDGEGVGERGGVEREGFGSGVGDEGLDCEG